MEAMLHDMELRFEAKFKAIESKNAENFNALLTLLSSKAESKKASDADAADIDIDNLKERSKFSSCVGMFSNGDNPFAWIAKSEVYFNVQNTPADLKVNLAKHCMHDDVSKALIKEGKEEAPTWEGLKDALLKSCSGVSDAVNI